MRGDLFALHLPCATRAERGCGNGGLGFPVPPC